MKKHAAWQESVLLTMDQFFKGTGWHKIQKDSQRYFRWTGPEKVSLMYLYPRRDHDNRLNITIGQTLSEDNLNKIQLMADRVPLHLTLGNQRNPAYVTAVLPKNSAIQEGGRTVLSIHVPETIVPAERNPNSQDKRHLGLCIHQINIFPLKRTMFTAQKYSDPRPFDGLYFLQHNPGVRDAVIHGFYKSAYEYFLKHKKTIRDEEVFELNENFDECPGDLYDIIRAKMHTQYKNIIKNQQEEISLLREVVYRQGEDLLDLRKIITSKQ